MNEQEYTDFDNYPIYGDVENFIKLLSSIAVRMNNSEENGNNAK